MAAAQASTDFTNRLEQLLKARGEHAAALAKIDETLMRVGSVLGGAVPGMKRRGRPPGSKNVRTAASAAGASAEKPKKGRRGRRSRGSFALSGEQSVLQYIEGNKNASTKDVNGHWKGEGRGGSADNTLSKLVREKKLKRSSIEGQRGSTYVVA